MKLGKQERDVEFKAKFLSQQEEKIYKYLRETK